MTIFEGNRRLLDAFRRGDRNALVEVYGRYVAEVATLIRRGFTAEGRAPVRGVADAHQQKDLIQEVFVRAFGERARHAYDGLSPFKPWLLRVAKNLMIDEARRSGKFSDAIDATELDICEPAPMSPEEELDWKAKREVTKAYCATLDPELKRLVQLRFEEERPQAEVAEAMGITRRRVRTLETHVRQGLKTALQSAEFQKMRPKTEGQK